MNIKNDNVHEPDHAWPCPLPKKTRKEVFFDEMNQVVPWSMLVIADPVTRVAHIRLWAGARRLQ